MEKYFRPVLQLTIIKWSSIDEVNHLKAYF
jgi:hypothetical protein